jgi:hypothetical protein
MDWIRAGGWALAALLVTTAWLLPWYTVWVLPLAALSDDRKLRAVSLAICAWALVTRLTPWLPDVL